jgi:DNA-binding MarR family transcriptional regulator
MSVEMRHCVPEEWSEIDLTIPQLKTLVLLRRSPTTRMGVIAGFFGTSLSSATSMVDRLVEKGLIERISDPRDRRVVVCQLTPQGREEVERFWRIEQMSLVKLADNISFEDLQTVVKAAEILCEASAAFHEEAAGETAPRRLADTAN